MIYSFGIPCAMTFFNPLQNANDTSYSGKGCYIDKPFSVADSQ